MLGSFCRIYAILLYAYPRDFRLQYGADMQQVFRDRCRDMAAHCRPLSTAPLRHSTGRPIG